MLPLSHVLLSLSPALLAMTTSASAAQINTARVLIYTATLEYYHDSIPTAVEALTQAGPAARIAFDHTADGTQFNDATLAQYDAVLFLSTIGEVLDDAGKTALHTFLDKGGNFIGVHAASDGLRNTTWFQHEVGAAFDYHPELQDAIVDVVGPAHPSTTGLPSAWHVRDEMYNFKSDPRDLGAVVVLSANESSYTDPGPRKFDQGTPHPTAWFQEHGAGVDSGSTAGRSFYTSLGHLNETWQDPQFIGHVMGGIQWALASNTTRAFNSSGLVGNTSDATTSTSSAPSTSTSDVASKSEAAVTRLGAGGIVGAAIGLVSLALFII